jgi:BioD-like phosphotransacetylase family protein
MSIQELENAIMMLSTKELANLTTWLIDYHEKMWDQQIEDDLDSGRFDKLLDEIDGEYAAGLAKSL